MDADFENQVVEDRSADRECFMETIQVHTHLPKMEPDAPTKCFIDDEPLVMRSGAGVACTSTEPAPRCAAGCKATIAYAKTLNFKCSGGCAIVFNSIFLSSTHGTLFMSPICMTRCIF